MMRGRSMPREVLFVQEMIEAAERICESVGELTVDELAADPLRRDAVKWNYMVLGEAANQLPAELKASYPGIEWSKPTQLRNKIVHGYWDISIQILHNTANEVLPTFTEQLKQLLADLVLDAESASDREGT